MDTETYYTKAHNLLDECNYEDAYATFLSVLELSIQQLHLVKFVHQTIVCTPKHLDSTMTVIRSSLEQLDKITTQNKVLPSIKITPPPPLVPPKSFPPSPQPPFQHPTAFTKVIPSSNKKPTVPPKPRIPSAIIIDTTPITGGSTKIRPAKHTRIQTEQIECEKDNGNDGDDVVIMLDNVKPTLISKPFNFVVSSDNPVVPAIDQSPTKPTSDSWIVQSDETGDVIDVLAETIVNPSNLAPAQTSDSSFHSYYTTDYVPNIPVPPLLTTYRRLQNRLNDLSNLFEEIKKQYQDLMQNQSSGSQVHSYYQRCQNDLLLSEKSINIASVRDTLDKVRTLYMSAITIPSILQFSPHLTAYQLTLIESSIFRNIPCEALLSHSPRTPHKNIVASTDFFNYLTRFIEHTILLPQEAPCRAKIIRRWIKIATQLFDLNNYQSLKATVSALGTPPVQRLKKTWECISKKYMSRLELLSTLMSESDNYCRYREHMGLEKKKKHQQEQQHHVWTKPVVPFLGVFIHDVTYLQCAAKGNTNDTRFQDTLNHMEAFQRAPAYLQKPPSHYYTNHGNNGGNHASKKHIPNAITNALHLGPKSTVNDEDMDLDLKQQLITQYLLVRPWVSEKTIDALSNLREPKSILPVISTRLSSKPIPDQLLNEPLQVSPVTPISDENKKLLGFWPFRKSNDLNRSSNTPPEPSWSEDDEDEEDEDEEVTNMTLMNDNRKGHYEKMMESQPIQYESLHHPNTTTISLQSS